MDSFSSSSSWVGTMNNGSIDNYYTYTTTTGYINSSPVHIIINRCRICNHAHTHGGESGCYDTTGLTIDYVACLCQEYVPQDNLEFLEYLLKKKEDL